jgi:predicted ATP-dependent endonuclease of OLD family
MQIQNNQGQFETDTIDLPDNNFFVIVGGNNSGKSTVLRSVSRTLPDSVLVNVNRTILGGEGALDKGYQQNYNAYAQNLKNSTDDNTRPQTQTLQDFFNLKDAERTPVIEWYNKYFPNRIYEEREDPENMASSMFLKINGHSITKQGSGMRFTLEIFIKLFDPKIKVLCIDEPELGLEPYLQKYLFQAIKDKVCADKKIFLSTHSHHFLDYDDVGNNYVCKRNSEGNISIEQVDDLKPVIFRLLGNTLSSLLLPENIIVLEGVSDTTILNKCLKLLNKLNYAIHNSGGDGSISYAVGAITQFLRFNKETNSVYIKNVYVIADKAKDTFIREWHKLLPEPERQLKILSLNGIEYFYPERILQTIFAIAESKNTIVENYLASNPNEYNNIRLTKIQLAQKVAENLTEDDLNDDTNELFVFLKTLK